MRLGGKDWILELDWANHGFEQNGPRTLPGSEDGKLG